MEEFNYQFLVCENLFGPLAGYSSIMSKREYTGKAKKISQLYFATAKKNQFLADKKEISGLGGKGIRLAQNADQKDLWHERFHQKIDENRTFSQKSSDVHTVEESFAESYVVFKSRSKEGQEELIQTAPLIRRFFNNLYDQKNKKGIQEIVNESLKEYPADRWNPGSYPALMFFLQYDSYTDLAMKFFDKYKIKGTIKHLLAAEKRINAANDHRKGVRYLNSKLDKTQKIQNLSKIPNFFKKISLYLWIESQDLYLSLKGNQSHQNLAPAVFEILLPALIKDDSVKRIWPVHFYQLYLKAKK